MMKIGFFLLVFAFFTGFVGCNLLKQDIKAKKYLTVWFVDVGQGDASVILTPQGKAIMIDIGNDSRKITGFLAEANIDTLEAVFVTHADLDHYGAFEAILNEFEVKRVILPKDSSENIEWNALLSILQKKRLRRDTLYFGDTLGINSQSFLKMLWPIRSSGFSGNNQSYVIQLVSGQTRLLFTGDIEEEAEIEIQKLKIDITSSIIKVAHHGSQNSSSLSFLSCVCPYWAVISCDSTVFGHPHQQTINALRQVMGQNADILRTDRSGDIQFRIYPERVEFVE
jgi:competence protein ComEC